MKTKTATLPEIKKPFTDADILRLASRMGKLKFLFAINFLKLMENVEYYGLEEFFDEDLFSNFAEEPQDYKFRAIEVRGNKIVIEVRCDVTKIVKEIKESD